ERRLAGYVPPLDASGRLGQGLCFQGICLAKEHCVPGAGTDKTKNWVQQPGPVVILVEPQMGENVGSAARAMANFGLGRLRIVKPREEWPNPQARKMASGADRVLDDAVVYETLKEAVADCTLVFATTARAHDQAKPVVDAEVAAREAAPKVAAGE